MYNEFTYYTPTKVVFGKGTEEKTGALIKEAGAGKALLHYGGGSAARSGLLDRIKKSLADEGIACVELGGVKPNPRLSKVYEGIELGRKEDVDFILAVGGGSVIDSAKAIALGLANPEDDVWSYYIREKTTDRTLPVGSVLTIAAAGSEMSDGSVITKGEENLKRDFGGDFMRPVFAVMNPELTATLPEYQTSCGVADILMHTMERFFNREDNMEITDDLAIALMRDVMAQGRILMKDPSNYEARANVMWAGSLSHNGLTGCGANGGDWATHNMEHEMGGLFDVAHGAGLAAIWGSWARYVHPAAPHRFVKFAQRVLDVDGTGTEEEIIERGIQAMEEFYREIKMPTSMKELGIEPTEEQIRWMAQSCEIKAGGANGAVIPLKKEDMEQIYKMAL